MRGKTFLRIALSILLIFSIFICNIVPARAEAGEQETFAPAQGSSDDSEVTQALDSSAEAEAAPAPEPSNTPEASIPTPDASSVSESASAPAPASSHTPNASAPVSGASLPASEATAAASEPSVTTELLEPWVNPVYSGMFSAEDLRKDPGAKTSQYDTSARDDAEAYDTIEGAGASMREQLRLRANPVVVSYIYPDEYESSMLTEIQNQALAHTGVPDEGDYIRFHLKGRSGGSAKNNRTTKTVTFTMTMVYMTDAVQESQMDSAAAEAVSRIAPEGKSDYEKIRAVHDFVLSNVAYDYSHSSDSEYLLQYSAYAALIQGTAVCQGYASLTYRLMLMAGIDCRVITGVAGNDMHAWNIVRLNDKYYFLDTTWDDSYQSYAYFLKCSFSDHTIEDSFLHGFFDLYPLAEADYRQEPSNITSNSVSFEGKLFLNTYIKLSEEIAADPGAYVAVTFNDETTMYSVPELLLSIDDKGRVKVQQEAVAAMMHDEMTLQVFNGYHEAQKLTYKESAAEFTVYSTCIAAYLKDRQVSSTSDEMRALARAAELYGIAAQRYFNYHTEKLTAEDLAAVEAAAESAEVPQEYAEVLTGELPEGITKRSKTVVFESDHTLRMYFYFKDAELGKYSFQLNGETVAPIKKSGGKYYIEQPNIASGLLSNTYTFSVSDGTDLCTIEASAFSYAYDRQTNSENANMRILAKLFYLYGSAAEAYFSSVHAH